MSEPVKVQLGKLEVELEMPASYSIRYEVFLASAQSQVRAWAAALGLCWKGKSGLRARYEHSYNPLVYGGQVMDELVARGMAPAEVAAAGVIAHNLLSREFMPEKEVAEAERFFGEPELPTG